MMMQRLQSAEPTKNSNQLKAIHYHGEPEVQM